MLDRLIKLGMAIWLLLGMYFLFSGIYSFALYTHEFFKPYPESYSAILNIVWIVVAISFILLS